jgi:CBS domain containing-hemolysin-like protein/mannitol/fructose-specific phosphotransferase system IIA component (Ntr-type)
MWGAVGGAGNVGWWTFAYVVLALFLVFLNGFFVLAEFAIVKVRASRLEELARQGNARARAAKRMVGQLDDYLSATQLGVTVASLGLGWVGEPAFASLVESVFGKLGWSSAASHTASVACAFTLITFLHILFGELAPKSMAIRRAEECLLAIATPLRWTYYIFYLPMTVLNGASNLLLRMIGLQPGHHEVAHSEEELRLLLSTAQTTGGFSLNRMLILENIFDLGGQTVREAMIPWSQVHYVSRRDSWEQIVRTVTETRFSRYPVIEAEGPPTHYLLSKDLITRPGETPDWTKAMRRLPAVGPTDNLEQVMQRLQGDGANMAIVLRDDQPTGVITLEDILEEVVGRIEDEYPRLPPMYLKDALSLGGVILDIEARDSENAIREMVAAIPPANLPSGLNVNVANLALARERQLPTDLGNGVAIPHARCPGLSQTIMVVGRSVEGIVFQPSNATPVRLIFLLVTPAERPQAQVFFLQQLALVAASELVRERIARVSTAAEVIQIIAAADPAITG